MENSEDNHSNSISSHFQLFTVNGAPLKFNLFGYSVNKFDEIVKIIETYGGKLSESDDPDTFVFSERNCPVKAGESNRYDFQYVLDSMDALQPQELMNYKLEGSTGEQAIRPHLEMKEQNDDKPQKLGNSRPQVPPDRRAKSPVDDKESLHLCYSSADEQNQLLDTENPCTAERTEGCYHKTEDSTDVDHLNKNESKVASPHHRNEDDYIDIMEFECIIPSVDVGNLDVSQSAEDSNSMGAKLKGKSTPRKRRSPRIQILKRGLKRGRREKIIFTIEESLRMIKWFKENKLLPACAGISTWKRMLREKVLPNHNCSYGTLKRHFRRHLQEVFESEGPILQPNYSGKRTLSKLWTDGEMQVVIKYLIDNDVIHRAGNREVMRNCLKVNKSLLHPTRTVNGLIGLFYNRLRYEYRRLTDDPVALKKFKRL